MRKQEAGSMNAISVHILTKHHLSSEKLTLFLGHLFVKLYKEKKTASQCPQTKSVTVSSEPKLQLSQSTEAAALTTAAGGQHGILLRERAYGQVGRRHRGLQGQA